MPVTVRSSFLGAVLIHDWISFSEHNEVGVHVYFWKELNCCCDIKYNAVI